MSKKQHAMRRPSIVFLNRVYPPVRGSSGRLLRDLAGSFAREGWQVTVITCDSEAARERDGAIRVIRLKGAKRLGTAGYMFVWLKMLWAVMRLPKNAIVVSASDPPLCSVIGRMVQKLKGSRHIHWCQDLYPDLLPALGYNLFPPFFSFLRAVSYGAMRKADKVIVIGRCMARRLSVEGLDPKAITVIPNWPDYELCRRADMPGKTPHAGNAGANEKPPGTEALFRAGPRFRVLYAGNIGLAHPLDTVLEAAEILMKEAPDVEIVFVGDGRRFDDLARQRSLRGLENIRLIPYQPLNRLRQTMESGDVHLISFAEEAAGMLVPSKLYAALAVGRPCVLVGPAQSEAAKVIQDFSAGAVTSQGDARELANVIRDLRDNGDHWHAAQKGAVAAGKVFVPRESINAWIERAWNVLQDDVKKAR